MADSWEWADNANGGSVRSFPAKTAAALAR